MDLLVSLEIIAQELLFCGPALRDELFHEGQVFRWEVMDRVAAACAGAHITRDLIRAASGFLLLAEAAGEILAHAGCYKVKHLTTLCGFSHSAHLITDV